MPGTFNEASRVQIPAIIHLEKLGYTYISLRNKRIDPETNILLDVFNNAIKRINPGITDEQIDDLYRNLKLMLNYDDLGRAFYKRITQQSGIRIIDLENFDNNDFNSAFEFTFKSDEEEFRPDITIMVNGIPLSFIEVKKPNNRTGIIAERDRIDTRFKNKHFKRFINEFQFLVFSNNMEYDETTIEPVQGAFYSSTSYSEAHFQYFREQDANVYEKIGECSEEQENFILRDTNYPQIKHTPEYETNKDHKTPTNRILSSLYSKERFGFILQFGIAYVDDPKTGLQKHVLRYPQLFALKAIEAKLSQGFKKGIIWHTQGSGKTALAYYALNYLTFLFSKKDVVTKFYFITDRLDLMEQASNEFVYRGLKTHLVNSKEEFVKSIQKQVSINNDSGDKEMNVVNIQKFSEESHVVKSSDYDVQIQRIYFLDEVHRSYNPTGSFLANLLSSDRNAIIIGLTGTPIIVKDYKTTEIFGPYFHTYYYNQSIADGYTLKLIREGIKKEYVAKFKEILEKLKVSESSDNYRVVTAHKSYVYPLCEYIVSDFINSRETFNDPTIGGMIVCDTSQQARAIYDCLINEHKDVSCALILHDVDDKETRRKYRDDFKAGNIDFLIVYNMLLTGFDAHRLKKMYLGRKVYDHNLLQTLTRVNRPYHKFKYGYVVDFADITKEFDKANEEYLRELQRELGVDFDHYREMFKSPEEIDEEIAKIKDILFLYDTDNLENFSSQISSINDINEIRTLKKCLEGAKELYNVIRSSGQEDQLQKIDFKKLSKMCDEVTRRYELINYKEALENKIDTQDILNQALNNIVFSFRKYTEEELVIADRYQKVISSATRSLTSNFDKKDPKWVSLYEELRRILGRKNLEEITQEDMNENIRDLERVYALSEELNRYNSLLRSKYENDEKFARLHKSITGMGIFANERVVYQVLILIKHAIDEYVINNSSLLDNEAYFVKTVTAEVIAAIDSIPVDLPIDMIKHLSRGIAGEYMGGY